MTITIERISDTFWAVDFSDGRSFNEGTLDDALTTIKSETERN